MKGQPRSEETKKKISLAQKGKPRPWQIGSTPWNKGLKGGLAKKCTNKHIRRGAENSKYKHGLSKTREYEAHFKKMYKARKKQAVGTYTFGEWETLKKQYGLTCPCCRQTEPKIKLTADHIIPLSRGGSNFIENIQPLCGLCNSKKSTKIKRYEYELVEIVTQTV